MLQWGSLQRTDFFSVQSRWYNEQKFHNERGGILSARAHDVSGLHALIRASVITFVIVCKFQFSVYFSYLLICAFSREILFMLFMRVRLFMILLGKVNS